MYHNIIYIHPPHVVHRIFHKALETSSRKWTSCLPSCACRSHKAKMGFILPETNESTPENR